LNGAVRVGLDDLIRKIFAKIDGVRLPQPGKKVEKGETLFSVTYGDYSLDIPSPISGQVISVNSEHAEHPEWLAIKPFELSWMCRIEPTNLAGELPGLRIGHDAVDWYQEELDRYSKLANNNDEAGKAAQGTNEGQLDLLARFAEPFLQA
jgi:glycine cleavage system H lipoate-binding protein